MRKPLFKIGALTLAAAVGVTPVTAHASAGSKVQVQKGNGYIAIAGRGTESLKETLKELGITGGNGNIICPPDTEKPVQKPDTPDTDTPDTEKPGTPDTDTPDADRPGTPDADRPGMPDTDKPGTDIPDTDIPDAETPEVPDTPDTEKPGTPDTEEPDTDVSDGELSSQAAAVLSLVNKERAKEGLPALKIDAKVTKAANVRAREIKKSFSHTRPDGSSYSTALKEQGVSYRMSGENIAWGQKTPEQVMNAWMSSSGHRANIMNKNYKNIGIGYYEDEKGVKYWVQLFTA